MGLCSAWRALKTNQMDIGSFRVVKSKAGACRYLLFWLTHDGSGCRSHHKLHGPLRPITITALESLEAESGTRWDGVPTSNGRPHLGCRAPLVEMKHTRARPDDSPVRARREFTSTGCRVAHAGDSDSVGWVAPIDDGWAWKDDNGR